MTWTYWDLPEGEQRTVRFSPAFHRCTDPKGNFGIGGVHMMWMLRIGDAAIGWDTFTDWGLPDEAFLAASPDCSHAVHQHGYPRAPKGASGGAVDFHMPTPRWDGHDATPECPFIGGTCYSDTGFILGSTMFDLLRTDGDDAVWARLRELLVEYRSETAAEIASR